MHNVVRPQLNTLQILIVLELFLMSASECL